MNWLASRKAWTDELRDDVAQHLSALRREVRSLSHDAGRHARQEANQLADALVHSGAIAARELGRQAKRAGSAIRRDPVPVVAGLIVLACLARLTIGRTRTGR